MCLVTPRSVDSLLLGCWDPEGAAKVVQGEGKLPVAPLAGKMKLTLLSPTPARLKAMAKHCTAGTGQVPRSLGVLTMAGWAS